MSKKTYTVEQIQDLKSNRFVKNCTEKSIQFTDEWIRKRKNTNDGTKDDKQVMISEKELKRILAENDVYKELLFWDKDKYP